MSRVNLLLRALSPRGALTSVSNAAIGRNVRRLDEVTQANLGPRIHHQVVLDTAAGPMRVRAFGNPGPTGSMNVDFARQRGDMLSYDSDVMPTDASTSVATIRAIDQALRRLLRESAPARITYTPTTASRQRLYAGLMRRAAPEYTALPNTSNVAQSARQVYQRPLTEREQAALQQHQRLLREIDRLDDFQDAVRVIDPILTYGGLGTAAGLGAYNARDQISEGTLQQAQAVPQGLLRRLRAMRQNS